MRRLGSARLARRKGSTTERKRRHDGRTDKGAAAPQNTAKNGTLAAHAGTTRGPNDGERTNSKPQRSTAGRAERPGRDAGGEGDAGQTEAATHRAGRSRVGEAIRAALTKRFGDEGAAAFEWHEKYQRELARRYEPPSAFAIARDRAAAAGMEW